MTDLSIPPEPPSDLDALVEFFTQRFGDRKQEIVDLLEESKQLRSRATIVQLGFEALLFRGELDSWMSFANQLVTESFGDQISIAHGERSDKAQSMGSKRPDATVVKSQAEQFIAPLKRAQTEIAQCRDWLDKILSWCQSQQKLIASDEFGELFTTKHEVPEGAEESAAKTTAPPAITGGLAQMSRSR